MATIIDWPSLPSQYISDYAFTGGKEVSVEIQSGGTYTATLSTTLRCRMTLHYSALRTGVNAPSPYDAYTEVRAIRDLLASLKQGSLARIADPVDGTLRLWRLNTDYAAFVRQSGLAPWYEAEIPLRSVE